MTSLEALIEANSRRRQMETLRILPVANVMTVNANSVFQMQRQLFARSERVKGIDFHPVEPWILTTLYSGMFLCGEDMDNC